MKELYFEDFQVGDRFRSSEYTMTESEMIEFARQFDPQPFHTDPEAAKRSVFGGLIASGWHTAAIAMRLRIQSEIKVAGGMIGMGVDELRWPRPVRSGDTIHLETEVIETKPSRSHPDHGIVRVRETALNQSDKVVMTVVTALWVPRAPQGGGKGVT
jgi:acyl dehydratase